MSSGAIKIHRAWLCLSQTIVLFSLMNFTASCSISEAIWGICGVWDFLPLYYMTPGCTFKIALPVLYLVHTIQNVFLYKMGELSVSGVVTSCQSSTLLLTCFLSLLLFTSCSLMETSGAEGSFLGEAREPSMTYVSGVLCFWGGVHGLLVRCFQEALSLLLFSPHPPGFRDVQKSMSLEVWSQQVGCYCIWKPSTFGSSALTSKIKRIPLFQQLSWLFAYLNVWRVPDMVSWGDDIVLGGFIGTKINW